MLSGNAGARASRGGLERDAGAGTEAGCGRGPDEGWGEGLKQDGEPDTDALQGEVSEADR